MHDPSPTREAFVPIETIGLSWLRRAKNNGANLEPFNQLDRQELRLFIHMLRGGALSAEEQTNWEKEAVEKKMEEIFHHYLEKYPTKASLLAGMYSEWREKHNSYENNNHIQKVNAKRTITALYCSFRAVVQLGPAPAEFGQTSNGYPVTVKPYGGQSTSINGDKLPLASRIFHDFKSDTPPRDASTQDASRQKTNESSLPRDLVFPQEQSHKAYSRTGRAAGFVVPGVIMQGEQKGIARLASSPTSLKRKASGTCLKEAKVPKRKDL